MSDKMEKILNDLTKTMFNRERTGEHCVVCGSTKILMEDFVDDLSWKEWQISHMCQICQDEVFNENEGYDEDSYDEDQDDDLMRDFWKNGDLE